MVSPFRESTHGWHVLREYAVIADGERGALIGPRGDIVWLCFPRWDDQAIFTTLLGGAGEYTISPTGVYVWGGSYETGTLIWRSRWITEQGIVECREALAYPGDPGMAVLLRSVTAFEGPASLRVWLDLRHDYGRGPARGLHREDDCWTGRLGGARFRWSGGAQAAVRSGTDGGPGLLLSLELPPGASHDFVLEISDRPFRGSSRPPPLLWQATEQGWRRAVPNLRDTAAVRDARHAYCVLRGMTSPRTGGMTAAATTSLPERAEQGRNYATSATRDRRPPFPAGISCSTTSSDSLPRGYSRTVRRCGRRTRRPAALCPRSPGWACPATRVARMWSATG